MGHAAAIGPPAGRLAPPAAQRARADRRHPDRDGGASGADTPAELEFPRAMHESKPAAAGPPRDRPLTRAADLAGQVWEHPNPIELYRFIRARNQQLEAIGTRTS